MRFALALALGVMVAGPAFAEDWPGWLGPRRDGSTSDVVAPWTGDLKVVWKVPAEGEGHSSPAVAGGKVFLHVFKKEGKTFLEIVRAIDAATGKEIWSKSYDRSTFTSLFGNGPRGTPLVVGDTVYTFGITGILSAWNVDNGDLRWRVNTLEKYNAKNLFFGLSASLIVEDGKLLVNVGGKGAGVVAFDAKTGAEAWKSQDDVASYASPVVIGPMGKRQAIFLTGKGVISLNPADGALNWRYALVDALNESSTTPVVMGDTLFISTITTGGFGLKMAVTDVKPAIEKKWVKDSLTCYFSTPVTVGTDSLYLVTGTKPSLIPSPPKATFRCVDPATGAERWNHGPVGKYHASLTRTGDGKLLLLEEKGDLVLVQPDVKGYRELSRSNISGNTWAHPAVSAKRLYIRDNANLICVELP